MLLKGYYCSLKMKSYVATYQKTADFLWSDAFGVGFALHNTGSTIELRHATDITDTNFTSGPLATIQIADGVAAFDAVTKFQLDHAVDGISHTNGNLTLSTTTSGNVAIISAEDVTFNPKGKTVANGNLLVTGTIITSSDERLKDNITSINDAEEIMRKIKPQYYTIRKDKYKLKRCGFIAQQIRDVVPDAVYENSSGSLAVDYNYFIGLLVKENQRLTKAVCDLQADMNIVKNQQ
jgi:hypothetical protein